MNDIAVPLYYQIYLQDLSYDYIKLIPLGIARTKEEASNCRRLFREALATAKSREVSGRNLNNCTVIFRVVLKE